MSDDVPEVDIKLFSPPGGARPRALRYSFGYSDVEEFIRDFGMSAENDILSVGVASIIEEQRKAVEEYLERVRRRRERLRHYQRKCKKGQLRNRKRRVAQR